MNFVLSGHHNSPHMRNDVLVLNVVVDADSIDLKALGCFPMSGVNSRLAGQNAFGAEYLLQSA